MFFKKDHNNEDTREIICKTMLIRHSGTIDEEKKTQHPIPRRYKVLETLVLTNK